MTMLAEAREWLDQEDALEREARTARLKWIVENHPPAPLGLLLGGGWLSKQLLEEVKYCFTYGQFVSACVLAFSLVERLLAAEFYRRGHDEMEKATSQILLKEALDARRITDDDYHLYDEVRRLRNPLMHFRRPGAPESLERRWIADGEPPWTLVEADARQAIAGLFRLLAKHAV